jgi:hypothetical protein
LSGLALIIPPGVEFADEGMMNDEALVLFKDAVMRRRPSTNSEPRSQKAVTRRAKPRGKAVVVVNDQMQRGYRYELVRPMGRGFHPGFRPQLTPRQMLRLGVFGGKYMTDCRNEFPAKWFEQAKLCSSRHDPKLNFFKVNASLPLSQWKKKGWIFKDDPRGWFQWYCRYYMGRRIEGEDERQIARWRAMRRHIAQIKRNCARGDFSCRPVQRQALLHWAYDSRKL